MNKPLYEEDFYRWSAEQAQALRDAEAARINTPSPIDWENVAEEIDSLGKSERAALRSRLTVIIEHLLKLQASSAELPRQGWIDTVLRERTEIEYILEDSPCLRREVAGLVAYVTPRARKNVEHDLARHHEQITTDLKEQAFVEAQVIGDWFPGDA